MSMMEKIYRTEKGPIHYWISIIANERLSLIFLPGLTADHRLFEKQTDYFDGKYRIFIWDAPGHGSSYTLWIKEADDKRSRKNAPSRAGALTRGTLIA